MKKQIPIKRRSVLNVVAETCHVDAKRLTRKVCVGGFTVQLDSERSLGRYNGKEKLFTLTKYGVALASKEKNPQRNPVETSKPKKKVKRPTRRKYAGLQGEKVGKGRRAEWHFTYRTKYAPLLLRAKKFMGEWNVYFGELRVGSGNTLVGALEQAKRRMVNRGYDLVSDDS